MNWHVVHTNPRQEALVELNLQKLGVETFYPQLKQNKVIRRRRQTTIGPLFPGYLFARFNFDTQYRAVNYAQGVRKVVTCGFTPAIVDDEMIESIKSELHNGYVTLQPPQYTPGQVVRIQEGPFQGFEAVFKMAMSDHQRVVLLLRALSYQARVVVDFEHVVAC